MGAVRARLLGGLVVEGLAERDLGSRKGRALLKVLAVARGAPVSRDLIAEVLWGDDQPAQPAEQVGVLVSRLRSVLGPDRITRTDAGYALVYDWLDVDELSNLSAAAGAALAEGRTAAARATAEAALRLVRGPLLPDEDGPWVEAERAAVAAAVSHARQTGIEAATAAGDHAGAARLAQQAVADDPYDEAVLRSLMRAHMAARRPAAALAAYARARQRLADDLGVPPTAETEALYVAALAAADGSGLGAGIGEGIGEGIADGADGSGLGAADAEAAAGGRGQPTRGGLDEVTDPSGGRGTGDAGRGDRSVGEQAGARHPTAPVPTMVGRDREEAVLDDALDSARAGGVALVLVEGEAGIGKTTLVEAWLARVGASAIVLRGGCDELGRDLPLQPVADALSDYLRALPPEEADAVLGAEGHVLGPLLGRAAATAAATVVTDPDEGRARVFAALVAVLGRVGAGRPAVVVVEDLHMAGPATVGWLAYARRRLAGTALVVTTRPASTPGLAPTHHVVLGSLGRDDVAALVGAEEADAVYARTGGHPLLVAALASSDPGTLRETVAVRTAGLGPEVATTLRTAAVLGPDCDLELIAEVAGTPVLDVLSHLERAAGAGLVAEDGTRFRFRHELVRESLVASTGAARRALAHQRGARALAARPGPDPLAVAVHAREGGDRELAQGAFVRAAAAAAARFDLDAAAAHLGSALALGPSAEALTARARVQMSRLAFEAAAEDARRAVALGGGPPALEVAGWVAYYRRRYEEAQAFADEAAARATDDAVRVSALALAGRARHGAGDLAGAVEHLAGVGEGPASVRGVADVWLAQARLHQGRPVDALSALARPMVDPGALAHPWAPLHLRFNRAMALGQLGRTAEGLEVAADLDAAVAVAGPVGARFKAPAANVKAWLLRWSGRPEEADELNYRALAATGGTAPSGEGMAEGHYVALLDLADGCLLDGDLDGAAALVERLSPLGGWCLSRPAEHTEAAGVAVAGTAATSPNLELRGRSASGAVALVAGWSGTMAWHQRHRLGLLRARLALAGGDLAGAAALADAVASDAAARGAGRYELLALALAGLADRSVPEGHLSPVVEGLGRCAAADGLPLVAALAAARANPRWQAEAERRAAALVAASPDEAPARRLVERVLSAARH